MMSIYHVKVVLLVLLGLSAAFNTVKHDVPFFELKDMFILLDEALEWIQCYAKQCSQRVSFHGILSEFQ